MFSPKLPRFFSHPLTPPTLVRPVLCLALNMPLLQQYFENRYNKTRSINNSALLCLALLLVKVIKHWLRRRSRQPAPNSEFVNIIQASPNRANL